MRFSRYGIIKDILEAQKTSTRSIVRSHRRAMSVTAPCRSLNIENINPHVKAAQYAVRGELAIRAETYRAQLEKRGKRDSNAKQNGHTEKGEKELPFDTVISANIGNPQQLGQKPITFFRQVAALLENPPLMEQEKVLTEHLGYKSDAIQRARELLSKINNLGAYSQSQGVPGIRESVAKFIEDRDGYPADPGKIFMTSGASGGVNTLLHVICSKPETGVLVPMPQYPLYTATLSILNARCVPYYLDESKAWGTDVKEIRNAIKKARSEGTDVRAIVIINPGNPTGASLHADDIKGVLEIAAEEKLVVMADEVYQTNVFEGQYLSFKKALRDLQKSTPGKFDNIELVSFHSISKGTVGECGHRGGYFELDGFDKQVAEQIYKFVSIQLCPPVIGQCLVEMMVNPPKEGEPSYELYIQEQSGIAKQLRHRAFALYDAFCEMEGVECQRPQGAMYLFPTINLPNKAISRAKELGKKPDEFYALRLLDATGVCVVPGSGFGQKEGSQHYRTTFLAPGTDWIDRIKRFHGKFMDEFRD